MKTATITFQNTNNYGAALQCYALHKTIISLGADNEVINYVSPYLNHSYSIGALREKGLIRYCLGIAYAIIRSPRNKNFAKFRRFIKLTSTYDYKTIGSIEQRFDLFIAGSDQVWNGGLVGYDKNYFLGFIKESTKKVSYAASFGFLNIPQDKRDWYKKILSDYKYYNVREESGISIIKDLLDVNANLTIDPTLLLSRKDWESVMALPSVTEPYILVYQLSPSNQLIEVVEKMRLITGYKVIAIPFIMGLYFKYSSRIKSGPAEWLGLFHQADYIITDSFHGTVFSVLFNKRFWACVSQNEVRITSLLRQLGLEKRLIFSDKNINVDFIEDLLYTEIMPKLELLRKQSLEIIKSVVYEDK
jgi:hypothetical protein